MQKAWNSDKRFFAQSYEDLEILDSALLIMPLVFFSTPVRIFAAYQLRASQHKADTN